jgi:hypothetical protein
MTNRFMEYQLNFCDDLSCINMNQVYKKYYFSKKKNNTRDNNVHYTS